MNRIDFYTPTTRNAESLADLARTTFWGTYRTESALERKHIKAYMDKVFTVSKILDELGNPKNIFRIASNDEVEIGYFKLVMDSIREGIQSKSPIEISRIYLKKEFWGKGFGSRMLETCIEEAEKNKRDEVWLSVWQHNSRAIRFYKKHGFRKVGTHTFDLASSPQIDFLMQRGVK